MAIFINNIQANVEIYNNAAMLHVMRCDHEINTSF